MIDCSLTEERAAAGIASARAREEVPSVAALRAAPDPWRLEEATSGDEELRAVALARGLAVAAVAVDHLVSLGL